MEVLTRLLQRHFSLLIVLITTVISTQSGCKETPPKISLSDPTTGVACVMDRDVKGLRRYLKAGGDPDATDRNGMSLLFLAANRHVSMVRELLSYHAAVNNPVGGILATPLFSTKDVQTAKLLLDHGAD